MTTTDAELVIGAKAPGLSLKTVDGEDVSLASLWPERPLALIFFAPFGGSFVVDHATQWRDIDERMREAGGEVVAICSAAPEAAAAFRDQWRLPYVLLCDQGDSGYDRFGVSGDRPGSFVIDTAGSITYIHRNNDCMDNPPSWDVIDAVSALTGRQVERPAQIPVGEEAESAAIMNAGQYRAPVAGAHELRTFACAKCGYNDYEVIDVSATSGMMSRMVNVQNRCFSAVVCNRCEFAEFYNMESGALRNIFDLAVGS